MISKKAWKREWKSNQKSLEKLLSKHFIEAWKEDDKFL